MLKFYKTISKTGESKVAEIDKIEDGCWISAIDPAESEISLLETELNIDRDYIRAALDEEESSRIEYDDGQTLIVIDYPIAEKPDNQDDVISYYTLPMGIILTGKVVVTVCLKYNSILDDFALGVVKNIKTSFRTQFVFMLMLRIAGKYLQFLKQIDKLSNYVERQLHLSMKNKELIQMLGLEKSLVYFSTSLKSTEAVLEKLLRGKIIRLYDEDQDLLEDVLVEVKQAIEMSSIYINILSGTMDAFASIISNNLNIVMKVLTIITIVMAVPTMVFSFYGMNTSDLPLPSTSFALGLAAVLSVVAGAMLSRHKFYK
jgi:magnesium transporter